LDKKKKFLQLYFTPSAWGVVVVTKIFRHGLSPQTEKLIGDGAMDHFGHDYPKNSYVKNV